MSEKKKQIIHVKELVIKADHVTLDRGNHDPFFGPIRKQEPVGQEEQESVDMKMEESESEEEQTEKQSNPFFGVFGQPMFGPRRNREFDPILGRPLRGENESSESISVDESKEEDN